MSIPELVLASLFLAALLAAVVLLGIAYFRRPKSLDEVFCRVSSNITPREPGATGTSIDFAVPVYIVEPQVEYDNLPISKYLDLLERAGYDLASVDTLPELGRIGNFLNAGYSDLVYQLDLSDGNLHRMGHIAVGFSYNVLNPGLRNMSRPLFAVTKSPRLHEQAAA